MERQNADPELALIRAAIRSLEGRERSDFEQARFNLFVAIETRNRELATRWLETCRVHAANLSDLATRGRVGAALDRIEAEVAS